MKLALVATLLVLTAAYSQAAVLYELDPEIRRMTQQLLREKNENYRDEAIKRLRKKGEHFDRARIEVDGVMASDDTHDFNHDDFDGQITPSFSADEKNGIGAKIKSWLGRVRTPYTRRDIDEMKVVMRGEMNQRAVMAVAPYRGMEINEIVAHSWGSELIYAAILNGEILPPKKLIVVGVPDNDMAKWRMLAARTGTEVHWARADNDAVALDVGVKIAKEEAGSVNFKAKWDALCARDKMERRFCHAHNRKSKPLIIESVGNLPVRVMDPTGHSRQKYYALLKQRKVIDGTLVQLRARESVKIEAETKKVEQDALTAAHREARELVEQARDLAQRYRDLQAANQPTMRPFESRLTPEELSRKFAELKSLPSTVPVASAVPPPPFSRALPKLKDFAVAACQAPEQVTIDALLMAYYDFSYRAYDDELSWTLASGMGDCPRQLFFKLIELIRAGDWRQTQRQWVRNTVAAYSRPPENSTGNYTPPASGGYSGGNSGGGSVSPPAPPPVTHDPEGEALEQLREIERRKRWGLRPVR